MDFEIKSRRNHLTYVFLGSRLPDYVVPSLRLANQHSGMSVTLIAPRKFKSYATNSLTNFVSTEDFYSNQRFLNMSQAFESNRHFRNGFWLRTLERFFVLSSYMKYSESDFLWHSEIDQLLFRVDILSYKLGDEIRKGIFVPFHDARTAVASLIFVNSFSVLENFLQFAERTKGIKSEMQLLTEWSILNPGFVHALPTISSPLNNQYMLNSFGINTLDLSSTGGIVDAAEIGQWVGGIDPRNVPLKNRPSNLFVDTKSESSIRREDFERLTFSLGDDSRLLVSGPTLSSPVFLYNLHLHSKIHGLLSRGNCLTNLFQSFDSSTPIYFRGTRTTQLKSKISDYAKLAFWKVIDQLVSFLKISKL